MTPSELRTRRLAARLSQAQLASRASVTRQTISRYEQGNGADVRASTLRRLEEALGASAPKAPRDVQAAFTSVRVCRSGYDHDPDPWRVWHPHIDAILAYARTEKAARHAALVIIDAMEHLDALLVERAEPRDAQRAVEELADTIRRCLVLAPPDGKPVDISEAHISNLARTIAMCLDEYGRAKEPL